MPILDFSLRTPQFFSPCYGFRNRDATIENTVDMAGIFLFYGRKRFGIFRTWKGNEVGDQDLG